jgi:hypothetical protein
MTGPSEAAATIAVEAAARAVWEQQRAGQGFDATWDDLDPVQQLRIRNSILRPAWAALEALIEHRVCQVDDHQALEAALDRVRALHPVGDEPDSPGDWGLIAPGVWCASCGHTKPCPTRRAIREAGA